jgi:Interferon-induced transmembrane protein
MKCANCNADNAAGATRCEFCDHPLQQIAPPTVVLPSTRPTSPAPAPPASSDNPYDAYTSQPAPPSPTPMPPPSSIAQPMQTYAAGSVPNYLVWAIVSTVCCGCMPLGVVAIVFAAQVDGKLAAGDYQGAVNSSNNAKLFSMIAMGIGLLGGAAYLGLMVIGVVAGGGG